MPTKKEKPIHCFNLPSAQSTYINFSRNSQFVIHTHSHYEIMILYKGKSIHYLNGHSKNLKTKTLVLIKPNETHQLSKYKDYESEHINIAIGNELFYELCMEVNKKLLNYFKQFPSVSYIHLSDADYEYLLHLGNKVNLLDSQDTHKPTLIVKQMVFNILTLFDNLAEQTKNDYPSWLHELLEKLDNPEFFLKPANELYQYAPYTQSKFCLYFKQYIGTTLIEYLTKKKINYACNLLQNTNFSILEIALTLNYESLAHFNRVFKKITGKTPREYKQQWKAIKI